MNNENLRKLSVPEKTIRLIEYLRKNTDENHTVKPDDIKNAFRDMGLRLGTKSTIVSFLENVIDAYNSDAEQHQLPSSEWRIVFDAYKEKYDDALYDETEHDETEFDETEPEEAEYDEAAGKPLRKPGTYIRNLYYIPEFSYEEIDAIIEAVLFSKTITTEETAKIITTLEDKLASKYYKRGVARTICKIHEKAGYDKELLQENLRIIQQAIKDNVQIEYQFNGYSHDKKLVPMGNYKRQVSPYYIVADNGRYYLLCANETYKNTLILRIDLMTEVTILGRNEKLGKKGIPSLPKKDIVGLPENWDGNFPKKHLNMSYDVPVKMKLRVKSEKLPNDKQKRITPDYTFLHDSFGDNYKFIKVDENDSDYDIIEVESSSFGMVNLALQYADKLEVLEPKEVREQIKEKLCMLQQKYLGK
ncbi:MAG: WYL domain-containing protein [Clostridium sp.]|nr:WYL domain-containing protein [Clostridium sp.]